MKVPQTNRYKRRSGFVDHVSEVRFEVGGLDNHRSRVFLENSRENREREWENRRK
jgi:hypothetical protein